MFKNCTCGMITSENHHNIYIQNDIDGIYGSN